MAIVDAEYLDGITQENLREDQFLVYSAKMGLDGPGTTGAGVQRNPFSTSISHTLRASTTGLEYFICNISH
jgi:hypothetical protein